MGSWRWRFDGSEHKSKASHNDSFVDRATDTKKEVVQKRKYIQYVQTRWFRLQRPDDYTNVWMAQSTKDWIGPNTQNLMIHNTQDWIGQSITQEEIVNSNNHKDWVGQLREMTVACSRQKKKKKKKKKERKKKKKKKKRRKKGSDGSAQELNGS